MSIIQTEALSFRYDDENEGGELILKSVSLKIDAGSFVAVLGHNGSGKSTFAKHLNAILLPSGGKVWVDGMDTAEEEKLLEVRRTVGMVFQNPDNQIVANVVEDDVAFAPENLGVDPSEIRRRVDGALRHVGMYDFRLHAPHLLSGGQKQRVAIARALADEPRILLSDEATSALDPDATESILSLLRDLNRQLGITIVLITHEMAVVKAIADRVAVMEDGRVVEEGSVYDIFASPQAEITRKFVASSSLLGKLDELLEEDSELVRVGPGELLVRMLFEKDCVGQAVISKAVRQYGFDLNLILANSEYLHGSPIGGMVGILSGSPESIQQGIDFLTENHVKTEVLRDGSLNRV